MKVLMASILDMNGETNGVIVSAQELIQALKTRNHQVEMVTPYDLSGKSIIRRAMRLTASVYHKTHSQGAQVLLLLFKALAVLKLAWKSRNEMDVFHAHGVFSAVAFLLIPSTPKHIFLQTHFHSEPWNEFSQAGYIEEGKWAHKLLKEFMKKVLSHPRITLLHVSHDNSKLVSTCTEKQEAHRKVLYPGLSTRAQLRKNLSTGKYFINVGKIEARKNQIKLVDVLSELKLNDIHIPLMLVGPADDAESTRIRSRAREMGVADRVIFTGQKDTKTTRRLIEKAALYLHTSKRESLGRTILEALQQQTPVLSIDYPAVREMLNEDAILPADVSAEEMASRITQMIKNESELHQLRKIQSQVFEQKFTTSHMLDTYESIYTQGMN